MGSLREHGGDGVSALFGPGPGSIQEALVSVTTTVSIVSSIGVAAVTVLFQRSRNQLISMLLGVVTLLIYSIEIMFSLYLSVLRPLTGTVPSLFLLSILLGFIPLGLGFTMFTLASAS
jgi:ABC-type transport system involved in cytochrome bd biosynthesis fused ATPase/permease subunit